MVLFAGEEGHGEVCAGIEEASEKGIGGEKVGFRV